MPGQSRDSDQSSSTSTSTSTATSPLVCEEPNHGNAANAENIEGGQCIEEDALEQMREAVGAGDGAAAWEYYRQLSADNLAEYYGDAGLQQDLLSVVYPVLGVETAREIFADLFLTLLESLYMARDAGILDFDLADALLNAPEVTVEEQLEVIADMIMGDIYNLFHGMWPHEVFLALAADQVRFLETVRDDPALGDWVFESEETLLATVAEMPQLEMWVEIVEGRNDWETALLLAEQVEEDWSTAYAASPTAFDWLAGAVAHPIEDTYYWAFKVIFQTGDGFTVDQKYTGFAVYYGDGKLASGGDEYEFDAGASTDAAGVAGNLWEVYHGVDPDDQAMTWLLEQYGGVPRPLLAQCPLVIMSDYWQNLFRSANPDQWLDNAYNPVANKAAATHVSLPTSYTFPDSVIAMRAINGAGEADPTVISDEGSGAGEAPGAVNRYFSGTDIENPNPEMNYFQNHATHEMGHAVGNRSFTPAPTNGSTANDYTKTQYGWQEAGGTAEGYARTLGFTAGMDGTDYDLADTTGAITVDDVAGSVIREFLANTATGAAPTPADLVGAGKFPTHQAALDAIGNHAVLKNNLLYKTVVQNNGDRDEAYMFPLGLAGGVTDVHYYAGNYGYQWAKYKVDAWNEKPSHYALSSHGEFWAEAFCAYYTAGTPPAKLQSLFDALDLASETDFAAGGGGGGPGAGVTDPQAPEMAAIPEGEGGGSGPAPLVPPIPTGGKRPLG